MKVLQYDVINNTSKLRKYKENLFCISMSSINFFIAILSQNLLFYDVLRSTASYTC